MLKQFNPDNFDYGKWVEQQRRQFLEGRLKNPYFVYSFSTTLVLLIMTAVCAKLRIDHRRAMWVTAEMMADLYNQDAYSRQVAQEAIERYNKHIERCNRAIETGENSLSAAAGGNEVEQLRTELMRVAEERDTAVRDRDIAREDLRRKAEILAEMSVRLDARMNKAVSPTGTKTTSDLRSADAKLVTHIGNLQEQLYVERNNNRRLKGG
jgi:primosomal protein N''